MLDPYDAVAAGDPFPLYARLRAEAPVHHVARREVWAISRYEDVAVALDPVRFSSAETNGRERRRVGVVAAADPPEHTRLRRPAAAQLTSSRLCREPERIRALAAQRIGLLGGGECDFVRTVAEPLACEVVAGILGAPPATIAALRRGRGLAPSPRRALRAFFSELVAERRRAPTDDLVSGLVADGTLREHEIADFCILLLAAGIDTTRDLLANLVVELDVHPAAWEALAKDQGLTRSAVEEAIRFTSPIQAMFRTATTDVELPGGRVPAGARAMLLFGSANRDERRWQDAASFEVARYAQGTSRAAHHLGLGAGPHACPGAWLAREVGAAALEVLLERRAPLRVVRPPVRGPNPCFRTIVSLVVVS